MIKKVDNNKPIKFGPLFLKMFKKRPDLKAIVSANKVSLLSYKELRAVAKILYYENDATKKCLNKYFFMNTAELQTAVHSAMKSL